jgi:hypothetical protein
MTSNESRDFSKFYAALRDRLSDPHLDLATVRDIVETVHIAAKEPEGVTYAEVDADGVEALWCVPADSDPRTVLCCTTTWVAASSHRCTATGNPPPISPRPRVYGRW